MSEEFTPEEIDILSRYVTNPTGNTFCVNIPGLAGPIYARYSRAITGLRRTLLKEFLKEGQLNVSRTQELIERILNEYGDDSVGELEGAHLALEQISNLVTKIVEDCRIGGSPIEQSTRYVFYDQKDSFGKFKYYRGKEISESSIGSEYLATMDFLFESYAAAIAPLTEYFKKLKPMEDAEYDLRGTGRRETYAAMNSDPLQKQFRITYNSDLRTKACDILRGLLPAATLTNVGLFGNGRYYQGLLTRLYSDSLAESNRRGVEAHAELDKVIPKFVKRAKRDEYKISREIKMHSLTADLLNGVLPEPEGQCVLLPPVSGAADLLNYTLAACLYPYSKHPLRQLLSIVRSILASQRIGAAKLLIEKDELQKAISVLQEIQQDQEDYQDACILLGQIFTRMKMHSVAVQKFLEATQNQPVARENIEVYYGLGMAYEKAAQYTRARETYEKILSVDIGFQDVMDRSELIDAQSFQYVSIE